MAVFAFRAHKAPTLYGVGTAVEAERYVALINRHRALDPYAVSAATDGEAALHAGSTFPIKQQTVRLLLGK